MTLYPPPPPKKKKTSSNLEIKHGGIPFLKVLSVFVLEIYHEIVKKVIGLITARNTSKELRDTLCTPVNLCQF